MGQAEGAGQRGRQPGSQAASQKREQSAMLMFRGREGGSEIARERESDREREGEGGREKGREGTRGGGGERNLTTTPKKLKH